jgi:hypothetical protein
MEAHELDLRCPRCDITFHPAQASFFRKLDRRTPRERFLHHAQRDHDLDEREALSLIGADRRGAPRVGELAHVLGGALP